MGERSKVSYQPVFNRSDLQRVGNYGPFTHDITGVCFGSYRIEKVLIADQVSQVCQAVNQEDQHEVILNLFLVDYFVSEEFKETFQTTCKELMGYEHPNLAPMIDSGLLEKGAYAAYACRDATPLQNQHPLPLPQKLASKIMFQVSTAVEYLHSQNRVHAHLSLPMIWVEPDDHVWLYDFGLRGLVEQEMLRLMPESYLSLGSQVETPTAPEQIFQREPSFQTDIYALGCLYFQLLTAALPYPSKTNIEGRLKSTFLPIQWPVRIARYWPIQYWCHRSKRIALIVYFLRSRLLIYQPSLHPRYSRYLCSFCLL